jgi:hypothetical protein
MGHAVEDGLLTVNPALKPGKFLPAFSKSRATNPYTHEEVVVTLLEVCRDRSPRLYPLLLCAVPSGLRQRKLKKRQGRLGDAWYLDEAVISIQGEQQSCGPRRRYP